MAESQTIETVEQAPTPEPETKMTPEEFSAKLESGEIDTSGTDPQELIEKMVDFGGEEAPKETSEQPQPAPEEVKEEAPEAVVAPAEEVVPYKNIGELMADAAEALGEKIPNARALVAKAKNQKEHLHKMEGAIEKWKTDATSNAAKIAELESKLAERAREVPAPVKQQRPPAPVDTKVPDFAADIPEIDPPGEFADATEVAKYVEKVRKRDNRIADKKMEWLVSENTKALKASEARVTEANQNAQQKIETEIRARQETERAERRRQESFVAAGDFVGRHKEFGIADVRDMNDKYTAWGNQVEYLKQQNPAFVNRDLVSDYFNGVQDAVQLLDGFAVSPPSGAKEFALVVELEKIALSHNMVDSVTGRPNFEEAYALKKVRDGVDIEETNSKVAKATEQVLDLVQSRQSAPQSLGASDVSSTQEERQITPEQISERMTQLGDKMSTMRPEERAKAQKELDEMMSTGLGINLLKT